MNRNENPSAKIVVHARIGREAYETLEGFATKRGYSLTQALRDVLQDLKQRELEGSSASRLDSLSRTLSGVVEQQAHHGTRLEALVGIVRKVEQGQAERDAQVLLTVSESLALDQVAFAHLMGIVESSPRAGEIAASAQAKLATLRGEG